MTIAVGWMGLIGTIISDAGAMLDLALRRAYGIDWGVHSSTEGKSLPNVMGQC